MKLINAIKTNNMPKVILWFFIYTLVTFAIGILCKVLVAWHVDEMHSDLAKTHDLFATAASMPGSDVVVAHSGTNGFTRDLTLGDIFSLDYISSHKSEISAGDGSADRFWIVSRHGLSLDQENFLKNVMNAVHSHDLNVLADALKNMPSQLTNGNELTNILNIIAGFQSDITRDASYALDMTNEANMVFWLQVALIILTLAAYPYGIYKMWLIKHNPNYKYDAKIHKRMISEYIMFLLFFIGIDTYATYLLIAEDVPMTFWNAFSVGSMAVPTGFAFGSLIFLHFNKKFVSNPTELNWKFKFNFKKGNN